MIRAYSMLWRAWVARYGLAFGVLPIVGALASTALFQQSREPGLEEVSPVFPQPDKPAKPPLGPDDDDRYENATAMTERLLRPPWERLPGVLCQPDGDNFGGAVSAHGLFVAVGASADDCAGRDAGAVYIFERGLTDDEWKFRARVFADPEMKPVARTLNRRQARFGRFIALSNGTLAVTQGGIYHGGPDEDAPEAVYVFGSNDGWQSWQQEACLLTPEGGRGHGIGLTFLDSHTLLVAAPTATPLRDNDPQGAVYVYHRLSDGNRWRWGGAGELRGPLDSTNDARFGPSLAAHDNTIAIAHNYFSPAVPDDGDVPWMVTLYRRHNPQAPPHEWEFLGGLTGPHAVSGIGVIALALHGSVLAATSMKYGERKENDPPPTVHLFRAEHEGARAQHWRLEASLSPPPPWDAQRFGFQLAIDSHRLAVGAPLAGRDSLTSGLIFIYNYHPDRGWSDALTLAPLGPSITHGVGWNIALAGDTLFTSGSRGPAHPQFADLFLWNP